MLNLLKSDFYKMGRSRFFWICTIASIIVGIVIAVALQQTMNAALRNDVVRDAEEILAMIPDAAGVWLLGLGFSMNLHLISVAAFTAIFISREFDNGTIKNTLSRGMSRTKVYFSKFLVSSIAALIMLICFMTSTLIGGTMAWGFDPNGIATASGIITMVFMQSLLAVACVAVFTFVSMTLRSAGASIALCVVSVSLMPTLLGAISMMLGNTIGLEVYWLGEAISNLATVVPASADIVNGIILAVAWSVVSIIAGIILFRHVDIK